MEIKKIKLNGINTQPKAASAHIKRYFERNNISASAAAKTMGISQSTVSRLLCGGSLSEEMAANLSKHYGLSVTLLFNMEARAHAYNAQQLLQTA